MRRALILLAHGARDPVWAQPFHELTARVRALEPAAPARLAFLELMQPDLEAATDELVAEGVDAIRIVPIFLGQGAHVRRDLPQRLAALRRRHPGVEFACSPAAGEDRDVIDALARFCLRDPESR
jgi:sirohydrochlorin cobaltochelatase